MRTKLRGKVTLLFMMLGMLLAVPTVALAADLLTEAELSSTVTARTEVAPNETTNFDIKVWARGNINNPNATGDAVITKAYTMGAGGAITANTGTGSTTTVKFKTNHQYGTDGQLCPAPADVPPQPAGVTGSGCATDPFVVPATLTVGNLADGTNGTLTVEAVGTQALNNTDPLTCTTSDNAIIAPNNVADTTDCTKDQGFVTVASPNSDPVVATAAADASGNEGSQLTTSGAFSDADGNGTLTITKQSGAGTVTPSTTTPGAWSWSHTPNDNSSNNTVVVRATDSAGAFVEDTFTWSAANVAPTATFNKPDSVDEGSNINLSLTDPSDPSSVDTAAGFQYAFDCDLDDAAADYQDGFSATNNTSCSTNDNGNRRVGAKIKDKDDGVREYTGTVTISNVAPTATFNKPTSVDEGSNINLSLTGAADVSSADTTAGFEYAFDCGDGNGYSNFSSTSTASCATTDNGSRSVGAKIRDKDGGVSTYTGSVSVTNVNPVISTNPLSLNGATGTACLSGNTVTLNSVSFTDVGTDDTHTGTVEWGDANDNSDVQALTITENNGSGSTNSLQHTYDPGTYTLTVTITDDDGGASSKTAQVSKLYNMGGILSPFNTDGSSTFKYGSTVPVKVQITDCAGTPVSGLAPKLSVVMVSGNPPATSVNEDITSTSAADSGSVLRYSDPQYIFNMNTKSSLTPDSTATYTAVVKGTTTTGQVVTNPAQVSQKFALKTK